MLVNNNWLLKNKEEFELKNNNKNNKFELDNKRRKKSPKKNSSESVRDRNKTKVLNIKRRCLKRRGS